MERGICAIAESVMTDTVIFQCVCAKLPSSTSGLKSDDFFSIFQTGGRRQLGFLNFRIFDRGKGQTASPCQISWLSVKPLLRNSNLSIFQDGGRRHLGFLNFRNFNGRKGPKCQTASPLCHVWWKSIKKCDRESAHRQTHAVTETNWIYSLSHAICYS